ncbi:MAG: polysaccharide biosynthesis protein [Eubacteriales bacterium]|nr:polysaccharide biosynthesis protein [Eubacteriales bacterium]
MNTAKKQRNFIAQGSILAITGICCRIIGMLYRIPLVDVIGTVGNGYYTSAYSIYNILLIISSYSLPTAISKVVSTRLAKERYDDVRTALRVAFIYATIMGGLMCGIMYFGSDAIANFMEKPFCRYALRTLAPTVWIMAYLGIMRGYFQGSGNMVPTAVSQVFEQIVNAIVSIVMAVMLFNYGTKANLIYGNDQYSYAYGAAGGTVGTGMGALVALLFFILLFLLYGRMPEGNGTSRSADGKGRTRRRKETHGQLAKVLLVTLIPILLSSTVYNISTVLDDFVFSRCMSGFGLAASVVFLWGIFGEYRILFNIPVAISNSLSSSVIPSLTNAVAEKNKPLISSKIKISMQFVMLISIPAAFGLFALAEPVCNLLFSSQNNSTLIVVLRHGCLAIILYSLSTITNGLLQGLGHLSEPLINAIIALVIHVISLVALIYVMKDITAVIYANTIFPFAVCVLNIGNLHKHVRFKINVRNTFVVPTIASAIMGGAVFGLSHFIGMLLPDSFSEGRFGLAVILCICIAIAMFIYAVMLVFLRAFTKDELLEMPMGLRIYRVLTKLHLM